MTERPNLIEFSLPAQTEVLNFLRKIWLHPLLDETTKKHREGFPQKFREWCEAYGIDRSQVAAVLVGSSQWVTTQNSDYDFVLYTPKESLVVPCYLQKDVKISSIHPVAIATRNSILCQYEFAPLFLTPDKFIAGNLELISEFRRMILGSKEPDWITVRFYFEKYIKGWPKLGSGCRFQRFANSLDDRAEMIAGRTEERVKTRYIEAFKRSLENLKLPSVEVYKEAISQTGGYLSLQI